MNHVIHVLWWSRRCRVIDRSCTSCL